MVEFDGGWKEAGHHQDHYMNYLDTTDNQAVLQFFRSVHDGGYTQSGTAEAIDVSVPAPHGVTAPEPLLEKIDIDFIPDPLIDPAFELPDWLDHKWATPIWITL